jgi:phage terminase small subunit
MGKAKEDNLTNKQENFAQCVALKGMTLTDAYKECYDTKTENQNSIWRTAYQIYENPKVYARIEELRAQQLKTVMLSTSQILRMYNNIAMANIEDAYDENGEFHRERLPKGCVKQYRRNKDGKIIGAELYDKQKSMDKLADIMDVASNVQTTTDGIEVKFKDELTEYSE